MSRIPEFIEILEKSLQIHLKKNEDYASAGNPFSNFEFSAKIVKEFKNEEDKGFVALIATKLARLAELSDGRIPNNESVDDSFLDLVTYCALWAAYRKRYPYYKGPESGAQYVPEKAKSPIKPMPLPLADTISKMDVPELENVEALVHDTMSRRLR